MRPEYRLLERPIDASYSQLLSLARKDETIHGSSPLNNSSPIGSVTEDADTIMLIKGAARKLHGAFACTRRLHHPDALYIRRTVSF